MNGIKGYVLTDKDFDNFRKLIYKASGIYLNRSKKELVHARLSKRLRQTEFKSFKEYYQFVKKGDSGAELVHLIDAISTNLTNFFREPAHFKYLTKEVFPEIFAGPKSSLRVRFWNAGCSTGEEPYSLAFTLLKHLHNPADLNVKILATDISTRVLQKAMSGVYAKDRLINIPGLDRKKYFNTVRQGKNGYYRVKDSIRDLITFRHLNLMEPFPFKEIFDVIMCRNVMIYFDRGVQETLVNKFYNCLKPGGYFLIGHSESLTRIKQPFKYMKPTIYRKK